MERIERPLRIARDALIGAGLVLAGFAAPAVLAHGPSLHMLDKLQPGMWELRVRGEDGSKRMCLQNGRPLIQIRHPGIACHRFVIKDGANSVTVQYTCPGDGYGRTSIRMETPTLAQVESQGIVRGTPFDFTAEARRVGACHG